MSADLVAQGFSGCVYKSATLYITEVWYVLQTYHLLMFILHHATANDRVATSERLWKLCMADPCPIFISVLFLLFAALSVPVSQDFILHEISSRHWRYPRIYIIGNVGFLSQLECTQ